jgi:ketosteroid isomerase-like protein
MKKFFFGYTGFLAACAIILLTACNSASTTAETRTGDSSSGFDLAAVKQAIAAGNDSFASAMIRHDSAAIVNHFTTDGKIWAPNMKPVEGRDAVAAFTAQVIKWGVGAFRDSTIAVYGNKDNVVEEGKYFIGDGKGNTMDMGKYVCVWHNENGAWKIYLDIWNSDNPAAPVK